VTELEPTINEENFFFRDQNEEHTKNSNKKNAIKLAKAKYFQASLAGLSRDF
jgi:hypothetical protein